MKKLTLYQRSRKVIRLDLQSLSEITRNRLPNAEYRLNWSWKDGSSAATVTRRPLEDILWLLDTGQLGSIKINAIWPYAH